jgi:hypothetical protein
MGYVKGEDMNTEDDEFNRIEREAAMRLQAVSAALIGHAEHLNALRAAARLIIPDAIGPNEGEHPSYVEGWNDCRREMLKGKDA